MALRPQPPRSAFKALAITSALVAAMCTQLASAQTQTQVQPTAAQNRVMTKKIAAGEADTMASQGSSLGQEALNSASSKTLKSEAGGPKGAGCTNINGKCVDNEELMGRGYDQARVDKAGNVDGKMSSLEAYYNEERSRTMADDGPEGAAWRVTEESADRKVVGRRELAKTNWDMTRNAQAEGRNGTAQGMGFEQCTTTSTVTPGTNPDAFIKEQQVCEIVTTPGEQGKVICTRERVPTANQELEPSSTTAYLGTPAGQNEEFCKRTTTLEPYDENHDYIKTGELDLSTEVGGLSCTRNRWAVMGTNTENKEKTASLGVNTEMGGLSCSRQIVPANGTTNQPQSKTADLPIDSQSGGNLCKRVVWPIGTNTPTTGSKTALLDVNSEAGGLSCTRTVWPTSGTTSQGASQDATLLIDTQTAGNLCTREAWPSAGTSTQPQTKQATLSLNNQTPGTVCTRTRVPQQTTSDMGEVTNAGKTGLAYCFEDTNGSYCSPAEMHTVTVNLSAYVAPGTAFLDNFRSVVTGGFHTDINITQVPTAANGWKVTFTYYEDVCFGDDELTDCIKYGPFKNYNVSFSWGAKGSSLGWTLSETGNCTDTGTPNCPTSWTCTRTAPTTLNGVAVSAADVQGLPVLFPGASNVCVTGRLDRVCGGTGSANNSISIAADLAPGTTSISGFGFNIINPQSGVAVVLTQTPSSANGWVAIFRVDRTDWNYKSNPQVMLYWNASTPSTSMSTRDTGNCSAGGSVNCPATWACTAVAPTTINGITVTASMAAQVAPLFPGASSSCARGSLNKVCSGTASMNTTVSLAARMPAGTTSISNLAFTVLNPQTGVTVTMTSAPTLANNWVATFRVDRTTWGGTPANPNIRITWNATTPSTTITVQDSGNCADPGSTACPTSWSCKNLAPYTVNGISVTAAMAQQAAPLFPGASNTCVVGQLNRVCSGSTTVGNTISIADKIPAGVTSITNFGFVVQNPQNGVTIALVSAPTMANGWTATFNVTRTSLLPPAPPQITMSWNMSVAGVDVTVQDTGDCSATGSAQCPAKWTCERSAPTTTNGIAVTTAMTAQVSPLFPGAANTCAAGSLDKACGGTANTQTSISIASQLPAGTTSIQGFTFSVNNPQSGVTVTNTQVPSLANNWVAVFSVKRTDFSTQKSNPNITMNWDAVVPNVTLSVQDSGNCGDVGSTSCPTQWQCVSSAPATVNGISITAVMAQTKAPLFPGASNICVKGELSRICTGSTSVGTTISVSELIPAGVHSIQNFAFTVQNPQAGVAVALVSPPSEANGWMATFSVTRTQWTQAPVAPQVKVTFSVDVADPKLTVQDTGNCNDPGSTSCPTKWTCEVNAPTTINGIPVTADMVTPLPPLFPSAPATCTRGVLNRVCGGSSATQTTISIADQIAEGTSEIHNFQWLNTNPNPDVTVTLVEAPSLANGWAAIFSVARNMSAPTVPAKPQITLTWSTTTQEFKAVTSEEGDCTPRTAFVAPVAAPQERTLLAKAGQMALDFVIPTALARIKVCNSPEDIGCDGGGGGGHLPPGETPPDDEPPPSPPAGDACEVKWVCTRAMPGEINGIPVSQAMLNARGPLYPGDGPPPSCLDASYQRVCAAGEAGGTTEVSIAQFLRPGTTKIFNYSWTLEEPGAGVSVQSVQVPALENNWIARFEVTRTDFNVTPVSPKVKLTWNQPGEVTYDFPIQETGDCSAGTNDEFCTTEWTCLDKAPEPTRPLKVCSHITTPWYNGAATKNSDGPADRQFDLQSFVEDGTEQIERFKYAVQTDATGCLIQVDPFPPAPTSMKVTQVTTASVAGTECKPLIRFEWDNLCPDESWVPPPAPPGGWGPPGKRFPEQHPRSEMGALNPTQLFLAGVSKVANAFIGDAKALICAECQEGGGGGGGWDGGDVGNQPPLFPGDGPPAACMKAELTQNCEGTWTGTECTTNSEGEEVCVTVDQGTPPNDECTALEEDPECQMIREECTDGAMSSSGWCYVKSRLYECKRKLPGGGATDPVITETTTCGGDTSGTAMPATCMDGNCSKPEEEESVSMSKAGAKMILLQHVMNDHSQNAAMMGATSPVERQVAEVEDEKLSVGSVLMSFAGIGSARAQSIPVPSNPFTIPDGVDATDQDPTDGTGGMPGSLKGMNVRFFSGKKLDCMKALGGLLNCCKKTPPVDQAPKLWEYMKKNLTQSNNAKGRLEEAGNGPSGFLGMIAGASQEDLMKQFTSNLDSLMGGGQGGDTNTDSSMQKSYQDFMQHETKVEKPKLAWYCDNDEFELAVGKQTGTCTHLGSYCQTKVLGMCIIKKDRYCCFNSPITRIIREDMDAKGIADLGSAKHPQCQGLTIEQVSKLNLDNVATDEVEGRMAQGKFNIDISALQNMSFSEIQSMFDGAQSLIGDETRKDPSVRNQEYIDQTDPAGAYGSLMDSQGGYRPEAVDTAASDAKVGLDILERDATRGMAVVFNVQRTGGKGAVRVRVQAGVSTGGTATVWQDYEPVDATAYFADFDTTPKKFLIKTLPEHGPRESIIVKLTVESGDAVVNGNGEATIWLKEDN